MPAKKSTTPRKTTTKPSPKPTPQAPPVAEILEDTPPATTETAPAATESFESAELAALREELAKAQEELAQTRNHPADAEGRPLPDEALTPEQKEIRNLQDQLAKTKGRSIESTSEEFEEVSDEGVLIHVLEDGFTAMGLVRYRGQEILFGPKAFEDTKDRFGRSWLNLTDEEQYDRWGSVKFRKGAWPGKKKYEDPAAQNKEIRSVAPITKF